MKTRSIIEYLLYASVFVFWVVIYPNHILITEQLSLFLYTPEYGAQYALQPGGWSAYCGHFLAQFFINRWIGALIQTLLCAVFMILTKSVLKKAGFRGDLLLVAVFPALLLLVLQCDHRFTPGQTLALCCPYALMLFYMNLQHALIRRLVFTALIVFVYLFSGAVVTICLYASFVFFELLKAKDRWKYVTPAWLFIAGILPYLWQSIYLTPSDELFRTINYPLPGIIRYVPYIILVWIPFSIFAGHQISSKRMAGMATNKGTMIIIMNLALACGLFLFPKTFNYAEEKMFAIYLAAAQNDWDKVLKISAQIKHPNETTVFLTNLALAQKGALPQSMFNHYQTDIYGLLPDHISDYFYLCSGSMFYYHIGMLNEAIRWIFDSNIMRNNGDMDYHTLTRLSVWNRENGYEQVASKYFDILDHTLMYRGWAKRQREAHIPQSVESVASPVEYFIGTRDPFTDLRFYYENYPENTLLLDYLLCSLLLNNDITRFYSLFQSSYPTPDELPKAYQEALLLLANMGMIDIRNYPIDKVTSERFSLFINQIRRIEEKGFEKHFGDTWWYYFFRKTSFNFS